MVMVMMMMMMDSIKNKRLISLISTLLIISSSLLINPINSQDPTAQQQPAPPATTSVAASPQPALNEKSQVYFGMWPDTAAGFSDTPSAVNARLGFNVSAYQIAQLIPLPKYNYTTGAGGPAPEYMIEQTQTDAAVLLTVYPSGFNVSDQDLIDLSKQLSSYTKPPLSRTVFLRFAPEMQGLWNPYGFQPGQFILLWKRMYQAVKAESPETAIVWAPNTPQSYPYGQTTSATSPEDLKLLDTNNDGQVTNLDDPFMPYYPGDDFVDWIGISTYYKGPNYQNVNAAQTSGYCGSVLNGTSGTSTFNWYSMFCNKPGKACMIAESGAAYHLDTTHLAESTTKSALELQRAWWQDCITSLDFLNQFPRIKLTMHFEHEKVETDGGKSDLRDYRITNETTILEAFKADFEPVKNYYLISQFKPLNPAIPVTGRPNGSSSVPGFNNGSTPTGIVFQTQRVPIVTGPPTLFGTKRAEGNRLEFIGVGIFIGLFGFFIGLNFILKN